MNKKILISLLTLTVFSNSYAITNTNKTPISDIVTKKWNDTMTEFNLTPKYHGFCFSDEKGNIKGPNPYRKVRLASTSKIVTTLMAIEKLGIDYEYTTKFYQDGDNIHIQGDLDPIISKRKLFFLLSQFNNLGITHIKNLTFDKNFHVFSKVEDIPMSELKPSADLTTKSLKDYFTTSEWNLLKKAYVDFINETPTEIVDELQIRKNLDEIELSVDSISQVDKNPLNEKTLVKYEMIAPVLAKYLKIMNIQSNNYIADQIFEKVGGEKAYQTYFKKLMNEKIPNFKNLRTDFEKDEADFSFYTGSGLNTTRSSQRVDNFASCALMIEMQKKLDQKLDAINREMQEIIAAPGVDIGTFKTRLNTPRLARSIVAKTGTLKHTSSLVGRVTTESGQIYFGMFHQMDGWKGNAKIVQNLMVSELLEQFGGPVKFKYEKEFFFPASAPLK